MLYINQDIKGNHPLSKFGSRNAKLMAAREANWRGVKEDNRTNLLERNFAIYLQLIPIYSFINILYLFHSSLISFLHCPFYMVNHMLSMKCQEKTTTCCQFPTANLKEFETETGVNRRSGLFLSHGSPRVCAKTQRAPRRGILYEVCEWAGSLIEMLTGWASLGNVRGSKSHLSVFSGSGKTKKWKTYWHIDLLIFPSTFNAPQYFSPN